MIDDITRQRILDTAQIVEVISEFVQLKKRGANYVGLCPFHNEKTPSFSVSESKGIFKCFGCGKAGNVVNFLMEHEKISYADALRWLAKKYHIEINEKPLTEEDIARKNERESILVATKFAHEFFVKQLHQTDEGKSSGISYLKSRGVRPDIIEKFGLGYSPLNNKAFFEFALNKGFQPEILQKAGLINKGNYDNFSGRIVFPIFNLSGNVVGFSGRKLSNDETIAKYFNTPDTEIFHKGKVLFGLFQSKKAIVEKDQCFLVEGNLDVLAMHQMGLENTVASLGTSLTVEQIQLIKRFSKNICLIYDSDNAGIKAAMRGIDLLLQEGMNVKVVLLPENHDPDSFSKTVNDVEFRTFIHEHEQDFILFKTQILLKDTAKDPIKRGIAFKEIVKTISLIPDSLLRAIYIKETSKLLQVDEATLHQEIGTLLINKKTDASNYVKPQTIQTTTIPVPSYVEDFYVEELENEILRILLLYGNETYFIKQNNEADETYISIAQAIIYDLLNDELEFKNLIYKQIFQILHKQLQTSGYCDTKELIYHENEQIREIVATLLSTPYYQGKISGQSDLLSKYFKRMGIYVKNEKDMLYEIINQLLLRYKYKLLEIAIKDLYNKLEKAQASNVDDQLINEHLLKIQKLTSIISKISSRLNIVVR
ncbi:MAG: DNA primase [Bacteroidales bacterium]